MTIDSQKTLRTLNVGGREYRYYSLPAAQSLGLGPVANLPFSLKVLLENQLRFAADGRAPAEDIGAFSDWLAAKRSAREIGFRPARVMMVDSSGVPLAGDMAAMRDAAVRLGGDPRRINPLVPVDFIIDHSVMADASGTPDAAARNVAIEFQRNGERYAFLKWAAGTFDGMRMLPPGAGICHQINLEFLARVVWDREVDGVHWAYPDSVLGMDSHTPMINSLGILGWGIGGLEGGAASLGEAVSLLLPEVVGCRIVGAPRPGVTSTDIVLTLTRRMRNIKLVGRFVEFFGPGLDALSLPDRGTLSNMTPEYGATVSFFPVDRTTLDFLRLTGRDEARVALVEAYCRAQGLWRDADTPAPEFTETFEFDLSAVEPSMAGPRRPHERLPLSGTSKAFAEAFPGAAEAKVEGKDYAIRQGDVVIAAITSCTNTSNPSVMVGAGLLARNARARGLKPKPWVKTTLSPGSRVVTGYLEKSGLQEHLDALGFNLVGYGCMSCMGNSGPIDAALQQSIDDQGIACAAVLSGNRNFEGRIHPAARANFIASPPLVVAYALAGTVNRDLTSEPIGTGSDGRPVHLADIWPDPDEVRRVIDAALTPDLYRARYAAALEGTPEWRSIGGVTGTNFQWEPSSQYIRRPPFFDTMQRTPEPITDIRGARVLGMFGDMLTTDHISPIGTIGKDTPAGRYLQSIGIAPKDFNNYASRRLNDEVMIRGTFANVRLKNEMVPGVEGGYTRHFPSGEQLSIFDAAMRYREQGVPLVVVAGTEYGAGSSRDWAAKGSRLLGVRAVVAEGFERIHRSNLVGMGVLPLELPAGVTRKTLGLDGSETFDITGLTGELTPRMPVPCTITRSDGSRIDLLLTARLDTRVEVDYYRHGGILHYVLRSRL